MTPMGSRATVMRRRRLLADALERTSDIHHLRVRELLGERVGDPVDGLWRLPGDEPELVAVEVALVGALAHPDLVGRVVEDRRRLPGRSLNPVVLAVVAL